MRILVTGGSGFIGSHLVDALERGGHEVKSLDIARPYREGIDFINVDVLEYDKLSEAMKGADIVYHLAAYPDISKAFEKPVEFMRTNAYGTLNVLEAARKNDVKRVLFSSSVWVYSSAKESSVSETTMLDPFCTNHLFTLSKIISEMHMQNYGRCYGQEFTILRYGVTYGPRAKPNSLVASFVSKILDNEEITIFGDGSQTRNLIHVNDIVKGNIAALKGIAKNKVYNLDGAKPVSINGFLEIVEKAFGKKARVRHEAQRQGDYAGKQVSIERARKELGWAPKTSLKEGLEDYAKSVQK